eukprot:CAMPEP_0171061190 /NCGR_PEP_ID=MMETSP0766_2-20121228/4278_1 /TAXON_ID=439317 /ORGANISM="Gambierdiscus australes, Strain CAWD 149" /LENGTH=87 /DNA_ID=CAMNT_0011516835 /DNA_START=458 /DNA_END=721 /DNA_ORIENTATION=+
MTDLLTKKYLRPMQAKISPGIHTVAITAPLAIFCLRSAKKTGKKKTSGVINRATKAPRPTKYATSTRNPRKMPYNNGGSKTARSKVK